MRVARTWGVLTTAEAVFCAQRGSEVSSPSKLNPKRTNLA